MPKPHTFPLLFDECRIINISDLKKWGYLDPNTITYNGGMNWKMGENITASIGFSVNMVAETPYIELRYRVGGEEDIEYQVELTTVPSNLGKGKLWYFVCPVTNKRCRKLYLIDKYFVHREACKVGGMYSSQTYSKWARAMIQTYKRLDSGSEIYQPYFKKYYKGKPTKRYLRIFRG